MKDSCEFTWFGQSWKCLRIKKKGAVVYADWDPLERTIKIAHRYSECAFLDTVHNLLTAGATYLVGCAYGHSSQPRPDLTVMNHSQMDMVSGSVRGAYEMIKANINDNESKRPTKTVMKDSCEFTFFGQTWKCERVKRNDSTFGGECDITNWTIAINNIYDDETFLDYLHHELIEGGTCHIDCDFTKSYPDREELFVFRYKELEVLSSAVRGAYEEIKQKIGAVNGWLPAKSDTDKAITKHHKTARH